MTTIGHVFIPLDREHDGTVPTDDDQARFEWRRRLLRPHQTCATGSCRLPLSLVAPLIATWSGFVIS
jgi:hypothetical protein